MAEGKRITLWLIVCECALSRSKRRHSSILRSRNFVVRETTSIATIEWVFQQIRRAGERERERQRNDIKGSTAPKIATCGRYERRWSDSVCVFASKVAVIAFCVLNIDRNEKHESTVLSTAKNKKNCFAWLDLWMLHEICLAFVGTLVSLSLILSTPLSLCPSSISMHSHLLQTLLLFLYNIFRAQNACLKKTKTEKWCIAVWRKASPTGRCVGVAVCRYTVCV